MHAAEHDTHPDPPPRGSGAFLPVAPPLSAQTFSCTAGIIRRHRKKLRSCWRKLSPDRQLLPMLAYLRKGETFSELAGRFDVAAAKAWRHVAR